jgi:outer membrane protein
MQRHNKPLVALPSLMAKSLTVLFLLALLVSAVWAQDAAPLPVAPSSQQTSAQQTSAQPTSPPPTTTSPAKPFDVREYAKPRGAFPNVIAPYTPRRVEAPNLANTPRIDGLMHDGKLYISMNDAVALALEDNLDIAIARYNLNIADTDIWRAQSGAATLGVPFGVVQNTPGGGVGGLGGQVGSGQGGTSVAAGGAGVGVGGIVGNTFGLGTQIASFDPILTGTFQVDHNSLLSSSIFSPFSPINTTTGNFAYQQGFQWGTNMSVSFNNQRQTLGDAPFQTLSPQLNSSFNFKLTQHLLQGFGFAPNARFVKIAKNDRKISDEAFRLQIITTVDQVENMYWDLVYAYENVKVQKESLSFAERTLSDTKKQVEIGTMAPIETVRAQSTVATDQQQLTVALTNLQLEQLLMKNALSRTLVDPVLADAEVIPTSSMEIPQEEPLAPTENLVSEALGHRPDLAEARINLTNTGISNKAIRNALLPTLDVFAYYGGAGLGGSQNPSNLCANEPLDEQAQGFCAGPNAATTPPGQTFIPIARTTSYAGTLNQLINSTAPDKGAGLQLTVPLRNRAAQALQTRSEFEYRQAQLRIQQIENQVRIEVRSALFGVQQNRASVTSAQAAVDLARQSLDAEQKKYALGASTSTAVLQNESAFVQAESTLVSAKAAYEKAQLELDRATGLLLDRANIEIAEALSGQVKHAPNVPHAIPRPADELPAPPPPQAQ